MKKTTYDYMIDLNIPSIFVNCHFKHQTDPMYVCVHPIGGGVSNYYHFLKTWNKNFSLIAIQSVLARIAHVRNIEELAGFYVQELLKCYPQRSYYLGGWSYGGVVAFEMARKLLAEGFRVPQLVLYDSYLPDDYIRTNHKGHTVNDHWIKFAMDIACQRQLSIDYVHFNNIFSKSDLFDLLIKKEILPDSVDFKQLAEWLDVYVLNRELYAKYTPLPLDLEARMFRCLESVSPRSDPDIMWKKLFKKEKYQVTYVEADHFSLFLPATARQLALDTLKGFGAS